MHLFGGPYIFGVIIFFCGKVSIFGKYIFLWKFWMEGGFGRKGDLVGRKEDLVKYEYCQIKSH